MWGVADELDRCMAKVGGTFLADLEGFARQHRLLQPAKPFNFGFFRQILLYSAKSIVTAIYQLNIGFFGWQASFNRRHAGKIKWVSGRVETYSGKRLGS